MDLDTTPLTVDDSSDHTLLAVLDHRATTEPDRTFIEFGDESVTYGELSARVDRVATAWLQMGLTHGDRVAIASRNSVDWLVTYLATIRIGAVLVTLSVMYREREFTHMLGQSGARLLVCEAEVAEFDFQRFLADLKPQIPTVEEFVFLGTESPSTGRSWTDVAATPADTDATATAFGRVKPTDPAVILYTSGTTGNPKGATLTHKSLLASAIGQVDRYAQSSSDTMLGVMPFNHVGGLTCSFGSSLCSGGMLTLLPGFHPDLVSRAIAEKPITLFAGVPTMYSMLLAAESFPEVDTSRVRTCVVGGSNLEPALADRVRAAFPRARLSNLYGLSETSGAAVISHPDDSPHTVDTTIGTPIGDVEARIVDDAGTPVATGGEGELQLRGTCVADGYWEMPDETGAAFLPDGWLATGDMGVMTEDGHISIRGRKKEMYVRGGYNVYPAEIENVLSTHPSVALCAVIGYPDATFGEKGCAFIVPASDHDVDTDELSRLCAQQLAAYKVPDRFEVVDSLPMTPAGKIRKSELRADSA
ncbi:MAG: acyl--CoA ligase [Corynebacterium sp.]|uniref:class I adenylate-forming enzyme family protein n=1 Tax=Corynebacterium sp. TaxID=1720 RepID=UPI0026493F66|nr:class I adenylate-forming enzyme family protein [Corynebacterium sp.]MDN5722024.1 acyl--CoA ligase [Corynebacterium sp.]